MEKTTTRLGPAIEHSYECVECRECVPRCPYDLDIPELLKVQQAKYREFLSTGVGHYSASAGRRCGVSAFLVVTNQNDRYNRERAGFLRDHPAG